MLAPSTPNCVTSLLSRRLKGKGIPGAQKAQKAREGEGRKSPPLLPSPSSAVLHPNSLSFPFAHLPHRLLRKLRCLLVTGFSGYENRLSKTSFISQVSFIKIDTDYKSSVGICLLNFKL